LTFPIIAIKPMSMPDLAAPAAGSGSGAFSDILQKTIGTVQSLQNDAASAAQKFMTGESEDVHTVALAGQQAELAFELGLQVRNKVVSAYQEVMKMQL
jgi:flagellar hook-basal body complex protein FliE